MAQASTIRTGNVVRIDGRFCKVLTVNVHSGGGKMGSMVHAKLRDLETGSTLEQRFETKDELDVLDVDRKKMQFLFSDGDKFTFMDQETYDQIEVQRAVIGPAAKFLKENEEIEVEFFEEKPLSLRYSDTVTLKVTSTGAGIRGQTDSTYKPATLENGMEILVPQFIKEGDQVHVSVETGDYLDRVKDSSY